MLNEPTVDKMKLLKLEAMAEAWLQQQKDPEARKLSFNERLGLLVDHEYLHRENKRLARFLREAKFRFPSACVEDIEYESRRQLDKSTIRQLASCRWIQEHQNVTITGATGTGKTYLACALAQQGCRKGFRAMYRRASRLFHELMLARADGTYMRLLNRIAKIHVLIIDDWDRGTIAERELHDLLEIIEDRYELNSTIITSQLPTSKWHEALGDPTSADAICDRILHNAHRIVLKGPSRRKEKKSKNN
jgi:DNA replication protein DnaC